MNSKLCAKCENIFTGNRINSDARHHENLIKLEASAEHGCHLCFLVISCLTSAELEFVRPPAASDPVLLSKYEIILRLGIQDYSAGVTRECLEFWFPYPESDTNYIRHIIVDLDLLPSPESDEWLCITEDLAQTTNSDQILNCVEILLNKCKHEHGCRESQLTTLPTRLIDLGPVGADLEPRLIEREDIPVAASYVTLSHCWGNAEMFKLLRSNVEAMKRRIPVTELSLTFQDAIGVARRLKMRYIWIDSLCIMQDSSEDWEHEASNMDNVYKNSFLNIAADSASDGQGGLFFNRDTRLVQPCRICTTWDHEEPQDLICIDLKNWIRLLDAEPLNKRAWVVQERILAPRVCHFTNSQLIWECCELFACERFPFGPGSPGSGLYGQTYMKKLSSFSTSNMNDSGVSAYLRCWSHIVQEYSSSKLTRESDRLVAISGIAKRVQNLLDDDYLAGMWRTGLEFQLLWTVKWTRDRLPDQYLTYVAPSWSWLSTINATVLLPDTRSSANTRLLASVRSVQVSPSHSMITCRDGSLDLRCYLLPIISLIRGSITIANIDDESFIETEEISINAYLDRPREEYDEQCFWVVPITFSSRRMGSNLWYEPEGLIVCSQGDDPKIFRRCGTFFLFGSGDGQDRFWRSILRFGEFRLNSPSQLGAEVCDQIYKYNTASGGKYEMCDNVPQFNIIIK